MELEILVFDFIDLLLDHGGSTVIETIKLQAIEKQVLDEDLGKITEQDLTVDGEPWDDVPEDLLVYLIIQAVKQFK